ncbi:MAG TPA: hypothetical protein VF191_15880, partial [Cyclobacteriaceae bacterium]
MTRIALISTFLTGLLGGIMFPSGDLRAQCTITNLDPTYCSSDPPVALTGSPGGLTFYRAGVSTPIASYDPSLVIGADTVVATSGVATNYTVSTTGTFAPVPSPAGSTSLSLADNSETGPISIGFTFNFFGNNYTNVYIGSNAIIGFSPGVSTPLNQTLPDATAPNNIIALAWDEITPSPGAIEYFVTGRSPFRKFVVNYDVYRDSNPLYRVRTQVQLHETTNIIEIHSTNINIPANFPTMGIENATGTTAFPVPGRNNASFSVTNDYVGFIPDCVDIRYLTISEAPSAADAGPAQLEQCNNGTFVMSANAPAVGTGTWTVTSGTATITNPTSATTTITGVPAGTSAVLRWTITNGVCTGSFDEIELINYAVPSPAVAGPDQTLCNTGAFTMAAT